MNTAQILFKRSKKAFLADLKRLRRAGDSRAADRAVKSAVRIALSQPKAAAK